MPSPPQGRKNLLAEAARAVSASSNASQRSTVCRHWPSAALAPTMCWSTGIARIRIKGPVFFTDWHRVCRCIGGCIDHGRAAGWRCLLGIGRAHFDRPLLLQEHCRDSAERLQRHAIAADFHGIRIAYRAWRFGFAGGFAPGLPDHPPLCQVQLDRADKDVGAGT